MADLKKLRVHTLASLSEEDGNERISSRNSRHLDQPCITEALVTAATLTHEQKIGDPPKALIKLGGLALIDHVLLGLAEAGFTRVVVLVGINSSQTRQVLDHGRKELYPSLLVEVLDLGADNSHSHASSILQARSLFDKPFLICPSDHMYESKLYERMADSELVDVESAVLVETDLSGMVGLPRNTVHVAFRPLDTDYSIHDIGCDLDAYNAIAAGLVAATPAIFDRLQRQEHRPYYTIADALSGWAGKKLVYVETKGATWFSVETDQSLGYSRDSLTKVGQQYKLDDGKNVHLLGHPKRIKTSPSTGGDWAEFSVKKWRSAVFTTKSFFNQLYEDTTEFLTKYIEQLGGSDSVCLIEVGCGTGEALIPLYDRAKYCIGVEINEDFVEFCEQQTSERYSDKVGFVCGDAEELSALLQGSAYKEFLKGTKKVVTCVGNTIGIIPEPKKSAIYKAMMDLAGPDGVVVTVYWNGNEFGAAVQHFYATNPQLCGAFEGSHIDIINCTLETPSGYATKWTKPEEARRILQGFNADVLEVSAQGRGVLTAFRRKQDA
eukprot:m.74368 g.74368  ORF g.74368 m.74368 type:complete len:551 (+) comp14357_c0_seq1:166-1818(+)